jgi:hypothetical protein
MVQERKLPNLGNKDLKVRQAKPRRVPEGMPRLHYLGMICGSRGSGKTNAMINMLLKYDETETFDYVYLFSPTYFNDPKYHLLDDMKADLIVEADFDKNRFAEIRDAIDARIEDWKKHEEYKKVFAKFRRHRGSVDSFDPYDLMMLYEHDFMPPDQDRYKNGAPTTLFVFDDLNYNKDLYSNTSRDENDFKRFAILHRHKLSSILFLCQTYKNGVPKQLRNNLSLMLLFKNKSEQMRKEIAEELSSHATPDEFCALWEHATAEDHAFLMIDYDGSKDMMFRKNFDTILSVQPSEKPKGDEPMKDEEATQKK